MHAASRDGYEAENCNTSRNDSVGGPTGPGALHYERTEDRSATKASEQDSVSQRTSVYAVRKEGNRARSPLAKNMAAPALINTARIAGENRT